MKKIAFLVLALGLMLAGASKVFAFDLGGYTGPIAFKFSDVTVGTLHGTSSNGYGQADGNEDAWGIFTVSSIIAADGTNRVLWSNSANEELTGMFYGLDDDFWKVNPDGSVNIQSVGGFINLYLDNTPDFNTNGGPGIRVGNTYPGATDGTLFLSLAMGSGIKFGDGDPTNDYITYDNNLDATTAPFTGDGAFYLDVLGGQYASMFNTNGQCLTDDSGNSVCRDFFGQFDTTTQGAGQWLVVSNDPIYGTAAAVPEPASLMLLGSGLFGLVGARLRKKKA